jgi:hypothetical protein
MARGTSRMAVEIKIESTAKGQLMGSEVFLVRIEAWIKGLLLVGECQLRIMVFISSLLTLVANFSKAAKSQAL